MGEIGGFVDLVRRVRAAQKAYFKDRTKENLIASKQLEKELDDELKKESSP